MRALLTLCLLTLCLLAGTPPALAAGEAPAAAVVFAELDQAVLRSCPPPPQICDEGGGCTPIFDCEKVWDNPPTFLRQKPNGKCIYLCSFTETCEDTSVCNEEDQVTFGTQRMRLGPFPPGECPYEGEVTCPNGEMLPPGEPD